MTDLTLLPGVGAGTAEKMKEGGVLTIMGVAVLSPGQMNDVCGMTAAGARKVIGAARDMCELGFDMGIDIEKAQEKTRTYIPTYCETIDELLGGGLQLGTTMEAFGQFSSGKTNLSHLLAVSAIKNHPDSYVVWIDTENTFSAKRIRQFCKGLEVDPEKALNQIKVGKAVSSDHQILLTESIEKELVTNKLDIKLVIIDSLMNHFRSEYLGRGTLATRQQTINGYLHKISGLVTNYGCAVYLTNQVQSDPGAMFGDPTKSIGGNIVAHFATTRLYMRKGTKGSRRMILVDSPDLPEGEANFMIKEGELEAVK
jgi:DNA repair protein RadA